jgi:hypothetical protein
MYTNLGEVCWLSDSVDTTEGHNKRSALPLGLEGIPQDVNPSPRGEDLNEGVRQSAFHQVRSALKCAQHLNIEIKLNYELSNFFMNILHISSLIELEMEMT